MGFLDTILGAFSGKSDDPSGASPVGGALNALLTQNGGLQGLMSKLEVLIKHQGACVILMNSGRVPAVAHSA
jgi:hypothetical protein